MATRATGAGLGVFMYGMVNKAVEDLVVAKFGEAAWQRIRAEAGVDVESFLSHEGYDDAVTYNLVEAASRVLGLPPERVLEAFGEWWVLETAQKGYGEMMDAGGHSLGEFLGNLANFHARVSLILPNLRPPEFSISDRARGTCVVHYYSHRPGLQHFVIGLLSGLGKRFDTPVAATLVRGRNDGLDHDEFLVRWEEQAE